MSSSNAVVRQFARFIKTHGYSQHRAAEFLRVSQPALSKVLAGSSGHVSVVTLTHITEGMTQWMDEVHGQEALLYQRLKPLCEGVPNGILRNVFLDLLKDH